MRLGAAQIMKRGVAIAMALALSACASLQQQARSAFSTPELTGTRWGLVVVTMDGRELVSIRPDERFKPASTTKLFIVAAAFHRLGDISRPDPSMGASVRVRSNPDGPPDIALVGGGDPFLIDSNDCERDCLSDLADMVVTNGLMRVGAVMAVATAFPHEPWAPGWPWDDLAFRAGAPVSPLVINSNEVRLEIAPGAVGEPVKAAWRAGDDLMSLANEAITIEGDTDNLRIERTPGAPMIRLYGSLGAMRPSQSIPLAIDDPTNAAAQRFRRLLAERGVDVSNESVVSHELRPHVPPSGDGRDPSQTYASFGVEIGRLLPPPAIEQLTFLTKQSQNLHAEQFLRRLGLIEGGGSRVDGLAIVQAMLEETGADRLSWDLHDGSGLSVYNRVTPRMMVRFLLWTAAQPWGEAFRETLPIGGIDGTLLRRFRGTALEGRIFAKTGTLEDTNALAGFMLTGSGEMLVFSAYANDRPSVAPSASAALDQALLAIATAR
jgi:D-alanyl-D-alanine carboxypeptidase/D-alanyl-D-alanine-endopeptidase (penicillin-binding protein 4)